MDGRPNRRNKAAFSNFSGVVWKLPDVTQRLQAYFTTEISAT